MQRVRVWSLFRELRLCITAKNSKHKNRSNIVTNTIKALKMVHMKKKILKKKQNQQSRNEESLNFLTLYQGALFIVLPVLLRFLSLISS